MAIVKPLVVGCGEIRIAIAVGADSVLKVLSVTQSKAAANVAAIAVGGAHATMSLLASMAL